MIDNKKYLKDVSSMYATAQRVKKYVMAELEKIDEKYRKIIAEEKGKLNEQLMVLNAQIKFYADIVNPEEMPVEQTSEKTEKEVVEEAEPVIADTIFPENNEPEEVTEPDSVAEDAGKPAGVPDAGVSSPDAVNTDKPTEPSKEEKKESEGEKIIEAPDEIAPLDNAGLVFDESSTALEGDPNNWPEYQPKEKVAVQEEADDWSDVQWN